MKPRVTVEVPFGVGMACGLTPQCLPIPSCTSPPPAFAADRKVPLPPFPPSCNKVDIAGKPLHLRHYSPKRGLTTLGVRPLPQAINPHSSRTSWPHLGEMLALRGVMCTPSLFSLPPARYPARSCDRVWRGGQAADAEYFGSAAKFKNTQRVRGLSVSR